MNKSLLSHFSGQKVAFESLLSHFCVTPGETPKVTFESLLIFFGVGGAVGDSHDHNLNNIERTDVR